MAIDKKIYGNAQALAGIVFGYDIKDQAGLDSVNSLLQSYITETEGKYEIDGNGHYKKGTTETIFDSDTFFKDMDTYLGFGQGDYEGVTTANMNLSKPELTRGGKQIRNPNYELVEQALKDGSKERKKERKKVEADYDKTNKDLAKAEKERIKNEKAAQAALNDPNNNKGYKKISDIINDPSLLEAEKPHRQRQIADRAYVRSGRQAAMNGEMPKFLNNASDVTMRDNDFLFRIDASDAVIQDVYTNVTTNTQWQDDYIRKQYDAGAYKKQFDFKAKKASDLTAEQFQMLREHFDTEELTQFKKSFNAGPMPGPDVVEKRGPFGMFKKTKPGPDVDKPFSVAEARRGYMQREFFKGIDPNTQAYNEVFNAAKELAENDTQKKALEAYQFYAKSTAMKGKTTRLDSAYDYLRQGFNKVDADKAASLYEQALSDAAAKSIKGLGSDGIKAASKMKGLKVAGAIAGGVAALWAMSEIYDE